MKYEDLSVGMNLICHQADGKTSTLKVVRKGIDGFGIKSVVFQSTSSIAQFYCKAEDISRWRIEPKPIND